MLGTTLEHLNALPVPLLRQVYFEVLFGVFFWFVFWGAFLVPKGSPKGFPKGSKIDEKEVSKRYLKKGFKKISKMTIFRTPQCGSSVVNSSKIDDFLISC